MSSKVDASREYNILIKSVEKLGARLDNLEKSQRRSTNAIKDSTSAIRSNRKAHNDLSGASTKLNASTMKMIETLRSQNRSFKDLGISSETVTRAMQGQSQAVKQLKDAYDKGIDSGMLQVRNNRLLSNSFATLRSKMLLASFASELIRRSVVALMKQYDELQSANLRVENTISTTGATALQSSFDIEKMANEIENLTTVSSTLVTEASAMMLTFTKISGKTFKDALNISIDLSKGFGQDLKTSVIQVGKALNDPIAGVGALRRVGVSFSKTQKTMIKNFMAINNITAAQKVILDELKIEVGGTAEAMAKTPLAKWTKLWNDLGPVLRATGQGVGILIEPIRIMTGVTIDTANAFLKLASIMTGKDIFKEQSANTDLVNSSFKRFKGTIGDLSKRELKRFREIAPGLTTDIIKLKQNALTSESAMNEFKNSMEKFNSAMNIVASDTENYNDAMDRMKNIKGDLLELTNELALKQAEAAGVSSAEIELMRLEQKFNQDILDIEGKRSKLLDSKGTISADVLKQEIDLLNEQYSATLDIYNISRDLVLQAAQKENALKLERERNKISKERIKIEKEIADLEDQILKAKEKKDKEALQNQIKQLNQSIANEESRIKSLTSLMNKFNILETDSFSERLRKEELFYLSRAVALEASEKEITKIKEFYEAKRSAKDDESNKAEISKINTQFNQLQSEMNNYFSSRLSAQESALNSEMNADIEAMRKTSEFKIAQQLGDDKKMAALEKKAQESTLKRRKKNFRNNQLLAVSNIIIDYIQGIAKETSKDGLFGLTKAGLIMSAASAAAVATVMAQKPPAFAQGGDFVTTGPQMIKVGDNPGGAERVQITPISSPNIAGPQQQSSSIVVNVSGNVLTQDYVEGELAENIKEAIRRGSDFGLN